MSVVTNVILITGVNEPAIGTVNAFLSMNEHSTLTQIDSYAGGGKAMECDVWAGAFNFFSIRSFIDCIHVVEWEDPEAVQLLLLKEGETKFVLEIDGLSW